jgi:hypothetical protein
MLLVAFYCNSGTIYRKFYIQARSGSSVEISKGTKRLECIVREIHEETSYFVSAERFTHLTAYEGAHPRGGTIRCEIYVARDVPPAGDHGRIAGFRRARRNLNDRGKIVSNCSSRSSVF